MAASAYLELLDWRRRTAALFADLRARPPNAQTLGWFRAQKDALFRDHSQSPMPSDQRSSFDGLKYWPFQADMRVDARFSADEAEKAPDGEIAFFRIGWLDFELAGAARRLAAFWIQGYAGGLFVPFRDATSNHETYGGGRYLLDTIKSADFGSDAGSSQVVLDFNYAYHPSCAYDPVWVCPLAPPESRLPIPIRAGERLA